MLKPYITKELSGELSSSHLSPTYTTKLTNSNELWILDFKLSHLEESQREDLKKLLQEYRDLFPDVPSRADQIYHEMDVGDAAPVKQHPYGLNPSKQQYLKEEIKCLLENDFIEPSSNSWSSLCILVPKPGRSYRMRTDYIKVNNVTKTDTFPIPRVDACINQVGKAKYVAKFDLLKGF